MVKFLSPPNAPEYHRKLILALNEAFFTYSDIQHFDSTDLPPASGYAMRLVYADDLATLVLSDGVDWFPVQLGAAI